MTERITEVELRDWSRVRMGDDQWERFAIEVVRLRSLERLIAEVRRLRGLVARIATAWDRSGCPTCQQGRRDTPAEHDKSCPWPELEAEAKAIAEENALE